MKTGRGRERVLACAICTQGVHGVWKYPVLMLEQFYGSELRHDFYVDRRHVLIKRKSSIIFPCRVYYWLLCAVNLLISSFKAAMRWKVSASELRFRVADEGLWREGWPRCHPWPEEPQGRDDALRCSVRGRRLVRQGRHSRWRPSWYWRP